MAQTIGLTDLITFQQSQNPTTISVFLNNAGGWISEDSVFQDHQRDYEWFKAGANEEFEPHEKDQLKYRKVGSFKSAIIYVTLTQVNFSSIKSSIQSSMSLDETLIDDPKVKMCKYSNATTVIETIEPFQPQKDNLYMYVCLVYNKQDYGNGFRIK